MRRATQSADAEGDFDLFGSEVLEDFFVVVRWGCEGDGTAPGFAEAGADNAIILGAQAGDELIAQGFDSRGDLGNADGLNEVNRSTQAQKPSDVVASAFEAAGVGAEGEIDVAEVLRVDDVHPADHERAGAFDEFAAAIKDAGAFGAEQPFMPIGREIIDIHAGDVDGEHAEGLNRIDAEEDVSFGTELSDAGEVVALAVSRTRRGKG